MHLGGTSRNTFLSPVRREGREREQVERTLDLWDKFWMGRSSGVLCWVVICKLGTGKEGCRGEDESPKHGGMRGPLL